MRMSLQRASPFRHKQCYFPKQSEINFPSGSISSRISFATETYRVVNITSSKYCFNFFKKEKRQGLSATKNLLFPEPISKSSSCSFDFFMESRVFYI